MKSVKLLLALSILYYHKIYVKFLLRNMFLFLGMGDNGLLYDSSCVSTNHSTKETLLWPFTLDVMPVPPCDIGTAPTKPFAGEWTMSEKLSSGTSVQPLLIRTES